MSDFPIQTIILPILVFVVVGFVIARNKKMMAEGEKTYSNFRLGEVAQRMRLAIQQGEPGFNLMMANANHGAKDYQPTGGFLGKLSGDGTKETRALLRGAPNGRPTELSYFHRTDLDVGFQKTYRHTFECRLSVQVARPFAPFEVVLRDPAEGMRSPPVMSLPLASFGDPQLDAKFLLFTADPRVARTLVPALATLTSVHFLHLRGSDHWIGNFATMMGSSVMLYSIEQVQYALDQIAAGLEGRAAMAMAS